MSSSGSSPQPSSSKAGAACLCGAALGLVVAGRACSRDLTEICPPDVAAAAAGEATAGREGVEVATGASPKPKSSSKSSKPLCLALVALFFAWPAG